MDIVVEVKYVNGAGARPWDRRNAHGISAARSFHLKIVN